MFKHAILAASVFAITVVSSHAHFLFIRITPAKENRTVEVFFSDRADAGDPMFVPKIAGTKLWVQQKPGKFTPINVKTAKDRLLASLPNQRSMVVVGECVYGVLKRKTPFLLRHFPKAMTGSPKELQAMKPFEKVPLEIVGNRMGDKMQFTVLRNGKPMPNAEIYTLAKDLSGGKFKCDANGHATWMPPKRGWYMVYASDFKKESGKYRGTAYRQIRDFATLSFRWAGTKSTNR